MDQNRYKAAEKKYKKTISPEQACKLYPNIVDFASSPATGTEHADGTTVTICNRKCSLVPIANHSGAWVIVNALSRKLQVELTHHCLADCLQAPNVTNLHAHSTQGERDTILTRIWQREGSLFDNPCPKIPKTATLSKVRWVTLGYQYDWTRRIYPQEAFVPFPTQLAAFCASIGDALGPGYSIRPEAAIINFYPEGAMMGGHVDDAEKDYAFPVISISIGAPCLFLLGGVQSKEEDPSPMILRSGDVLVMGGDSRLSVHGVPKVYISRPWLHPRTAGGGGGGGTESAQNVTSRSVRGDGRASSWEDEEDEDRCKLHLQSCPCFLRHVLPDAAPGASSGNGEGNKDNNDGGHGTQAGACSSLSKVEEGDHDAKRQRLSTAREHEMSGCGGSSSNSSSISRNTSCSGGVSSCSTSNISSTTTNNNTNTTTTAGDDSSCYRSVLASECTCEGISKKEERRVLRFLQTTRININVRQVHADNFVRQPPPTPNNAVKSSVEGGPSHDVGS